MFDIARRTRIDALLAAALLAGAASAQTTLADVRSGDLRFTLGSGDNVRLYVRGVPVITESSLYLVSPGWQEAYLSQDSLTPRVTTSTEGDARVVTAEYETMDAAAEYRYQVGPGNTFKVSLTFRMRVKKPGKVYFEYDAGYIPAALLAGRTYTAQTVEGPRQGTVPLVATSESQIASRVMPFFTKASFASPLGTIAISVDGNTEATRSLNLFDARLENADWAKTVPIFWLGMGSPEREVAEGDNTVSITWDFGMAVPNVTVPGSDTIGRAVAETSACVPRIVERPIIPKPKQMDASGKPVRLNHAPTIIIPDAPTPEEKAAARELQFELKTFWNVRAAILRDSQASRKLNGSPTITLRVQPSGALKAAPDREEGYTLVADDTSVLIIGHDPRGVYNGAQTLKQLLRVDEAGVYVKPATIRDWPSLKFRGVHWFGGPNALPFHQKMLSRIIAPLKMNAMVYQCDYTQWESQPEIWSAERSTPKKDVIRAVELARNMFIEPIPMVNGMGHAEWLFWNGKNLDICADPETPYAWHPGKERTYEVVFGVMQEALDMFKPKEFHLGNDEVTMRGKFPPPDSDKTVTELILQDTKKRYDWLKERGVKTMMWGDTLLYRGEANDAALAPTPEDARARREGLPKDIVIADWHYTGSDPDFKSVPLLQGLGFEVIGCSWYNWANIRNWARSLVANKSRGLLQTTWAGYSMFPDIVTGESAMQFAAYVLAAEYAWSGGETPIEELGYNADETFQALWNRAPVGDGAGKGLLQARPGFTIDLSACSNAEMWDWWRAAPGWTAAAKSADATPTGRQRFDGVAFDLYKPVWLAGKLNPAGAWPVSLTVDAGGRKASALEFVWGTTFPASYGTPVANVTVEYTDGTRAEFPVRAMREILAFDDLRAAPNVHFAWRGTAPHGAHAVLRRWAWTNSEPSKAIRRLVITSAESEAAPVILGITGIE